MSEPGEKLLQIIDHVAHLLPAQGPISVFIHHNTLHAFQHLHFEKALVEAATLFGAEPYLSEERFRQEFSRGRIEIRDIEFVIQREPDYEIVPGRITRHHLLKRFLLTNGISLDEKTIFWELEEGRLAQILNSDSGARELFHVCNERLKTRGSVSHGKTRLRKLFFESVGIDLDERIHPLLIRLCASYLDQGLAYWPMADRDQGFFQVVQKIWTFPGVLDPEKMYGLGKLFKSQLQKKLNASESIIESLQFLGVDQEEWEAFLTDELLALPGWAGMFRQLEVNPHLATHVPVPCSLLDFLAVRLILLRAAVQNVQLKNWTVSELEEKTIPDTDQDIGRRLAQVSFLFDALQRTGLTAKEVQAFSDHQFSTLQNEIFSVDSWERRRLFHLAYERWHERKIIDPIAAFQKIKKGKEQNQTAEAQVFFCLDEREESIRRHLEEIAPQVETYGAAGFFGVAVNYTGIDDGSGASLCPIVIKPQHAVRELPIQEHQDLLKARKSRRKILGKISRGMTISSRTLVRGWLSTIWLGVWSIFPMAARILAPRRYAQLREILNRAFLPQPRTELTLMRADDEDFKTAEGLMVGFSIQEKADRVASVLLPVGLKEKFSRIVVVLGHGSTSLNNPYESAYDCGACGGRGGGPNGRLFAAMANHPEVRVQLKERGIFIPEDTWFVGGYHDTCSDDIDYFDIAHIPPAHQGDFEKIRNLLDQARTLNAHERSRRFEAADRKITASLALHHVEERSEHLSEPRPELGHCTNSITHIGRRFSVRGLFFDRRAFLTSYDPTQDPDDENLSALLGATIPVCAGINLEYFFSTADNARYGSGTKLPHNVTSLIGVMNGHSSDLLTGLPSQMIEIHEPVRSLFIVETTPERFMNAMSRISHLDSFVKNHWIRLVTMDPETKQLFVYRGNAFEPYLAESIQIPIVRCSKDWYEGKMDHLPVARIEKDWVAA